MLFNSFEFAWFFAIVFGLYVVTTHRAQNVLLLAASYWFYGAWNPHFLLLIGLSTLVDFLCGTKIEAAQTRRRRKLFATISVVTNLGILACYKYFNFFVGSMVSLLQSCGLEPDPFHLEIILPVGISFYTFQTMSYTLDVYHGRTKACRNLLDFAVFVAFFPQLVAGPIERASRLIPQISNKRVIRYEELRKGSWLILLGLFKKIVVADNLADLADPVFGNVDDATGSTALLAVYAFAFQIFCDFSGYSDIARGLAKLMGFELMQNFRMPYFATSPVDFWRRWHISLSTWLRDYLYIPLGGNRKGTVRTCANLMLTMILGGLWHGAAWNFVAWGLFHGTILVLHRLLTGKREGQPADTPRTIAAFCHRAATIVAFFHVTCMGWILFRVEKLTDVPVLLGKIASRFGRPMEPEAAADLHAGFPPATQALWFLALVAPIFILQLCKERTNNMYVVKTWPAPLRFLAYMFLVLGIVLCGVTDRHEFLYFQF